MCQTLKTVAVLYQEFRKKFTDEQIASSVELTTLFGYLTIQKERARGEFILEPEGCFQDLLKNHLNYSSN